MSARRLLRLGMALVLPLLLACPASAAGAAHVTGRLLARAAPLAGANGLAFDAHDNLWVGSASGQVTKMNPDTGRILAAWGVGDGVNGADDLAFGPDGNLYYTSIMTGEVGRLTPSGLHTQVVNLGMGVNPITFADDGRLFVGQAFFGDTLYEIDPAGSKAPRLVASGLGLNGFDWADGYLWAPRMYAGTVVKIDVETGAYTTVAGGFAFPGAVKVGPDGALYVSDQGASTITRVDRATGARTVIGHLDAIDNLAFDSRGRLFASDADRGTVVQVLRSGRNRVVSPGGVTGPAGLAVLTRGGRETVYAADVFRLYGFDGRTGRTQLDELGEFSRSPHGLTTSFTVGAFGSNVVTTSWMSNAVQVYDPVHRNVLATWTDFAVPLNAIGVGSDIVVAELGTGRVVQRNSATGARTTLAQLAVPTGLAAKGGTLWVADWAMGAIFQVMADGVPIAPRVVATGLAQPEGLAVARDGSLLVVETAARRVSRVDVATGRVTPLIENLAVGVPGPPGMPPIWTFDGIAVGASGAVYVSAHGVRRYDLRG